MAHSSTGPAANVFNYNYYATEAGSTECTSTGSGTSSVDDTKCDTFTLTANLEGGNTAKPLQQEEQLVSYFLQK